MSQPSSNETTLLWKRWDDIAKQHAGDPAAELQAQLRWIAQYVAGPKYRGCPFLNIATEFPSAEHPARVVALRNKNDLRRRLALLAKQMKVRKHEALADQLLLLIDGAYVDGQLFGKTGPSRSFLSAATALVTAARS